MACEEHDLEPLPTPLSEPYIDRTQTSGALTAMDPNNIVQQSAQHASMRTCRSDVAFRRPKVTTPGRAACGRFTCSKTLHPARGLEHANPASILDDRPAGQTPKTLCN